MDQQIVERNEGKDQERTVPFFSIVIPVWNRSDCIKRCLDSVFAQNYQAYEIIAVDDGSDDNSVDIMKKYTDSRLKIIECPENRGVCAARNTGTAAARGLWIVSLDTDWALLPGTLCKLAEMAEKAPPDVGLLGGCAITDQGELWPVKLPPERAFGFVEFLKWKDTKGASDFQACRRREVFEKVQWPTDRRLETQFHMKVAKVWKTMFTCETLSKAYTDSPNRWSTDQSSRGVDRVLKMAPYLAQDNNDILANFGEDLRRYTPRRYWSVLQNTVFRNFQAGDRLAGLKYAIVAIVYKPWMVQIWGIVILGLIGPRTLLKVNNTLWVRSVYYWFKEFNYRFWKK